MYINVICFITPIAEHFQHNKSHLARHSYFFKEFQLEGLNKCEWRKIRTQSSQLCINTNNIYCLYKYKQ